MRTEDMKVGMKVRAKEDCDNDFAGGEGVIESISNGGRYCEIRITKKAKLDRYTMGKLINNSNWAVSIEPISTKISLPTHVITWDTINIDPHCVVYNNKEKADKIKELLANDDVVKDSIRVYSVKAIQKVEYSYKLKNVK